MSIEKVSIIGLGALGIMYAHHLSERMPAENLRIVADEGRIQRYEREGIYCNGQLCQFNYVTPEKVCEPADLILFTVKFTHLAEAIEAVKHHVGKNTILLSALNGITSEEHIGEAYGPEKVVYCVAQGMDALREANKVTYEHKGILCIGEKEPGIISPKVKRLASFFDEVDLPYEIETNMQKRMWGKFMLNVGVNQTVAVHRSNFGAVQREGPEREMMIAAMQEVLTLSEKEGINLTQADIDYWLEILSTLNPLGKPSMAQDVEAERATEVELFAGTVIALGKKHGVPTPVNEELYRRIKEIEAEYT